MLLDGPPLEGSVAKYKRYMYMSFHEFIKESDRLYEFLYLVNFGLEFSKIKRCLVSDVEKPHEATELSKQGQECL